MFRVLSHYYEKRRLFLSGQGRQDPRPERGGDPENRCRRPFGIPQHEAFLGEKFFIQVQDVKTIEQAQNLVGKTVYLPLEMLPKLSGKQFYFHEIVGFTVVDTEKGELGPVSEVLEYPTQAILQVMKGKKEILIPILDQVIQKVDRDKKILTITAPEGLIDMYLQ